MNRDENVISRPMSVAEKVRKKATVVRRHNRLGMARGSVDNLVIPESETFRNINYKAETIVQSPEIEQI